MPVRLDRIPALAPRAKPPRAWLWLVVLPLLLLCGWLAIGWMSSRGDAPFSSGLWERALVVTALGWCITGFLRVVLFVGQQSAADGWDESREKDLQQKLRVGRRSLQVLAVSLHTASGPEPLDETEKNAVVPDDQPVCVNEALDHDDVPDAINETPERAVGRMLEQVLADLSPTLARLPDDTSLALQLLIDAGIDAGIDEAWLFHHWKRAWQASGIRQRAVPATGDGLVCVDQMLDRRAGGSAILMVLSLQLAQAKPEGTTQSAVGLLLAHRSTRYAVAPIAYLHRPEQQRDDTPEALQRAMVQALDWASVEAASIERFWRAGIDASHDGALATALSRELNQSSPALCNLDVAFGAARPGAPWLAIAVTAQAAQRSGLPQLMFSAEGAADTRLWSTVVTSSAPISK